MIWSEDYLNQQLINAGEDVAQKVQCLWQRFTTNVQQNVSVYTLPPFVRSILNIQWRGYYLDKANWEDLQILTPATVFVSPGNSENVETTSGRPLWYALHPTNPYDFRLFPTPSETFISDPSDDPYSPDSGPHCIIECYRSQDDNDPAGVIPRYIDRRIRKAYVLSKAFRIRGKGQNLKAAEYYQAKYDYLISEFNIINQQPYVGKRYGLDDDSLDYNSLRYPKPTLNPNFERTIYR